MIFRLNEEILRQALALEIDERMDLVLSADIPPHIFSKRFDRRMCRLQKRAERPRSLDMAMQTGKKAVIILLAAAVASGTTALSVGAIREKLFHYIEEKYTEYSKVYYKPTQTNSVLNDTAKLFVPKVPAYIPEGYELMDAQYDLEVNLYYQHVDGTYIRYLQTWIKDTDFNLNTEDIKLEKIKFYDKEGYYYNNFGVHTIMWNDGEYAYYVGSNRDKKTVLQVAKKVKGEN